VEFLSFLIPVVVLLFVLFGTWHTASVRIQAVAAAAKKIGLQNRSGNWFTGIHFSGKLNGFDVILRASFERQRDILTLILNLPSSNQIEIRRTRDFLNIDISNWLFKHKPTKFDELTNNDFEVFSDDVFFARRIFSDPDVKPLLQLCIVNQTDSLVVHNTQLALAHEVTSLSDQEILDLELSGMWKLANVIFELSKKPILKSVTVTCPYCHDRLMNEGDVIQCEICSALHHEACWKENRRCAVFQCAGSIGKSLQVKN
jgi:hypothetical protein